ncbi:MAG: GMC oxidoreductase [Alphaproteobacteria bacterium]
MFSDLNDFPDGHVLQFDLCIVGGGAAGISIALEFADTALNVCLLESAAEYHEPSQLLYDADQRLQKRARSIEDGVHYGAEALHSRLRYFGGSTNHWGGYCVPLTPHDLEKRDWIPDSGWPIDWTELSRFYPRAQALCEAGPFVYDESLWRGLGRKHHEFDPTRLQNRFYQFSPPTRFGDRYGAALRRARNIEVVFNANAMNIGLAENARTAGSVTAKSFSGKQATIRARHFVVACGGIENARLLLSSDDVAKSGVGNSRDLVGRYFMDHLYDTVGSLLVSERPDRLLQQYGQITPIDPAHPLFADEPVPFQAALCASEQAQKANRAGGAAIFLRGDWETADDGIRAVYQALDADEAKRTAEQGGHLLDILSNLDTALPEMKNVIQGKRPDHLPALFCIAEQVPNRSSRILLDTARDALGARRALLDWRLSEQDRRTLAQMPSLLAAEFGRLGIGRVYTSPWLDDDALYLYRDDFSRILEPGRHHSGTTRMASDPGRGVVNADCRLFDVENVSIAGSSVFPTIGYANPTLTILALSVRLADHLKRELG